MGISRRSFLKDTIGPVGGLALLAMCFETPVTTASTSGTCARRLGPPDDSGLRLPAGFTSRIVARSGEPVAGTGYVWHAAPDGGGCFRRPDGGWIYASNSEVVSRGGGVSCLSFDAAGDLDDAYSILSKTSINCAGGTTPWGTWLSCEEFEHGIVWECDPQQRGQGIARPALGTFVHEAAAVDVATGSIYLTEDQRDGRLYRFVPDQPTDLASGSLAAAMTSVEPAAMRTGDTAEVTWRPTSATAPDRSPMTASFDGGEGIWIDQRRMLFTTKNDRRIWALDLSNSTLSVLHDCVHDPAAPLDAVDNITVHGESGEIFVAEDGGNMQIVVIRESDGALQLDAFVEVVGHQASEVAGLAFSPDGTRLYFSSQRGQSGRGITYEVTGPFASGGPWVAPLHRARRMSETNVEATDPATGACATSRISSSAPNRR